MRLCNFSVIAGPDDNPLIVAIDNDGKVKHLAPEDISSILLRKMREIAEVHLGPSVKNAVITAPACFNDSQRQAIKKAGSNAGLNVMHIIDEPIAAAVSLGLHKSDGHRNVVAFDLGASDCNVSLLTLEKGAFKVKAAPQTLPIGGRSFACKIMSHIAQEFNSKTKEDVFRSDSRSMQKLKAAGIRAVTELSSSAAETKVEIESLWKGIDFSSTISRSVFEKLCMTDFFKCIRQVVQCLEDAKMEKSSVDDVILFGGCAGIPKVQELLTQLFNGKELCMSINPDEDVTRGAALLAAAGYVDNEEGQDLLSSTRKRLSSTFTDDHLIGGKKIHL